MSLFSSDNILLKESTISSMDIDTIGYLDTEFDNCSFVQEGYNAILELNGYYINAEKAFVETVLGSYGDNMIINESFSDFFGKIKDIIKKFIDWIKKVFKEFITKLNALVSNEKYLKKNKDLFNKFDTADEFEYKGYKFTKINDYDVPKATALAAFDDDNQGAGYLSTSNWYDAGRDSIESSAEAERKIQTQKVNDELDKKLNALNDSLDDYYDKFRGRVIGKDEAIYSSDFSKELFELFRDGDSEPVNITITSSEVLDAYRRFDNHKDTIKNIEKTQKEIIKDYEALEKYLDKMIKVNKADKDNMTVSFSAASAKSYVTTQIDVLKGDESIETKVVYNTSTTDKMNNYLKVQSSKVSQMCQIHTQAFSAKLEATKDQFKQDKKILYKALQQVIKHKKEG